MADKLKNNKLNVVNHGFNRSSTDVIAPSTPLTIDQSLTMLQWWESPLQAKIGIEALSCTPYLLFRQMGGLKEIAVPPRFLYPQSLKIAEQERIVRAAQNVAALVRQARELYTAAKAAGVSELSSPILYFYGALALAKAASITLFGVESSEDNHGLGNSFGPSAHHPDGASWPTIITWQSKGTFAMLYRTSRWDELYQCCPNHCKWGKLPFQGKPQFHVLECIRWLRLDWGILDPTGFKEPTPMFVGNELEHNPYWLPGPKAQELCLLNYEQKSKQMYMTPQTSHNVVMFQVPRIIVQYMLLYYFSILARYYANIWQELLRGETEPEGYVFRVALENIAQDYLQEIVLSFLARPGGNERTSQPEWYIPGSPKDLLNEFYSIPNTETHDFILPMPPFYPWHEWEGDSKFTCS